MNRQAIMLCIIGWSFSDHSYMGSSLERTGDDRKLQNKHSQPRHMHHFIRLIGKAAGYSFRLKEMVGIGKYNMKDENGKIKKK